jgi:TRAP-type C4-dicarboxylate transport system permease small subunit
MKLADFLRSVDAVIHKILLVIAQTALLGMIVIVCVTVFCRYVLSTGIIWAEEVPRTLVALFAFIACAMGVRDRLHISVAVLYRRFKAGGAVRRVMDLVLNLATLSCGAIMTVYGWNLCSQLWRFTMAATGLPRSVQYISMPIAGVIIVFDSLLFLFGVLKDEDRLFSEKEEDLLVVHEGLKASCSGEDGER